MAKKQSKKSYTICYDSLTEPVSKLVRSFETVCPEPPHCLSGAFGQLVRTLRTNRENIPHKTQTAYIRPWNRLNQDTKQAGSASNGVCFYQLPKLSENKKNQYFLAWIEKKAYLCTAASWPIVGKRAVKVLLKRRFRTSVVVEHELRKFQTYSRQMTTEASTWCVL